MENKKKPPKFIPDTEACQLVADAFSDIKERMPDIRVNLSVLGSFIVKRYFEKGMLKKDEKLLEQTFFNKKKYLKRVIQEGGDIEEAINKLSAYISKPKTKKPMASKNFRPKMP